MNEREEEDERTEQIPREAPPRVVEDTTREEWSILTPFSWFFGVI